MKQCERETSPESPYRHPIMQNKHAMSKPLAMPYSTDNPDLRNSYSSALEIERESRLGVKGPNNDLNLSALDRKVERL